MIGQHYSIPMDGIALQPATLGSQHDQLPDINDPSTADRPIRKVCCIGAGYVGMRQARGVAEDHTDSAQVVRQRP